MAGCKFGEPGATGRIAKGEYRYYKEDVFPAIRKYIPKGVNWVLFIDYSVYSRGNLVGLANSYGKDTVVIACHYGATGNVTYRDGHAIDWHEYGPDKVDLGLLDLIGNQIGLAYPVHKGHKDISGRSDLDNPHTAGGTLV